VERHAIMTGLVANCTWSGGHSCHHVLDLLANPTSGRWQQPAGAARGGQRGAFAARRRRHVPLFAGL